MAVRFVKSQAVLGFRASSDACNYVTATKQLRDYKKKKKVVLVKSSGCVGSRIMSFQKKALLALKTKAHCLLPGVKHYK